MQLNRVLPPGPREYWVQLTTEQKNAPEHTKWMYDADPFAARKEVEQRQVKAAKKREETSGGGGNTSRNQPVSNEFSQAPEVKMASGLRETVEEAVKKASARRLISFHKSLRTARSRLALFILKQKA